MSDESVDRDMAYVEDILDSVEHIQRYLAGVELERFVGDSMLQDAILRRLSVIGEAAACLSTAFRTRHADVPWKSVVGFRNLVVHRYWAVDLEIVWRIVSVDVPSLGKGLGLEAGR
jgi:uncharacterized protein with HEPN domain